MARPRKQGLTYFPLDCILDDKISMLEAAHGNDGFVVWIKLLQTIYLTPDGRLDISLILRRKTLAKSANVTEDAWNSIVDTCVVVGIFEREAFADGVLTSPRIRETIEKVDDEREKARNRASANSSPKNSGRMPQRKRKERKGKYTPSNPPPGELSTQAQMLYELYPNKEKPRHAVPAIANAIVRESEHGGFEYLLDRVRGYASAVDTWPEDQRRYVPAPEAWFNGGKYAEPSSEWVRRIPRLPTPMTFQEAAMRAAREGIVKWQEYFEVLHGPDGKLWFRDPALRGTRLPEGFRIRSMDEDAE